MALYRVEITTADGERDTVTVEADNVRDAREKARAEAEPNSTVGLPVLEAAPTRAARPTVGAGDVGEEQGGAGRAFSYVPPTPTTTGPVESYIDPTEWGDAIPSITAPPGRMTFRDFTQTIDPDLIDPRSSSYVPPPVTTAPPVTGFDPNINPDLFDPGSSTYVPPVVPPTVVPPTVIDPGGLVSRGGTLLGGGGFGPTDQAGGMGAAPLPPAPLPPAPLPPGAAWPISPGSAQPGDVVPLLPPIVNGGGAVNGAGGGLNLLPSVLDIEREVMEANGGGGEDVINPATGIPILTSREMIDDQVLRRAGMRRALQNVFGQQLGSGVGPLAGYLQRQAWPLSDAMTAGAYADMARAFGRDRDLATLGGTAAGPQQYDYGLPSMGGAAATGVVPSDGATADFATQRMEAMLADPKDTAAAASDAALGGLPAGYSFEDFLRTTRDQDTGLGGAYGQALQDVGYLRGLGRDALPPVLQSAFDPGSAEATADVAGLLGAAQRGRYSGLVSSRFRQPTQQDLFADYFLSKQDAAKAGTAPQNFLNFAAQRYGL